MNNETQKENQDMNSNTTQNENQNMKSDTKSEVSLNRRVGGTNVVGTSEITKRNVPTRIKDNKEFVFAILQLAIRIKVEKERSGGTQNHLTATET